MSYLAEVQLGVDYIETQLDREIALADVAEAAGMSQWHFQRIFKALTNETLKSYIRSRRMARALDRLLTTDDRIIDIAIAAGFESQQSFTRAFGATFDITPSAYRQLGDKSLFLKKVQFDETYLHHVSHNVSPEPEIYRQPSTIIAGLPTVFYNVDSEKNNISERLPPLWDAFLPRMDEIRRCTNRVRSYGLIFQPDNGGEKLHYLAGLEVSSLDGLPHDMTSLTVPEATYARFYHRGRPDTLDQTVNYIYSTWLSQSGMRHTYGPDIEMYDDDFIPNSDDSIITYAVPVVERK